MANISDSGGVGGLVGITIDIQLNMFSNKLIKKTDDMIDTINMTLFVRSIVQF